MLVEGDDHNEPIADAVRAILDGHIVMERAIAERGRYPAINVLKSVSRSMPRSADPAYLDVLARARQVMATYADMEELIRLGAYRPGSSPEVDEAIGLHPAAGGLPGPGQGRINQPCRGISAACADPGSAPRRWKPKTNVIAPQSRLVALLPCAQVPGGPAGMFGRVSRLRGSKSR